MPRLAHSQSLQHTQEHIQAECLDNQEDMNRLQNLEVTQGTGYMDRMAMGHMGSLTQEDLLRT
jgi:hypothetical protein